MDTLRFANTVSQCIVPSYITPLKSTAKNAMDIRKAFGVKSPGGALTTTSQQKGFGI
jgi:hypothetical protein